MRVDPPDPRAQARLPLPGNVPDAWAARIRERLGIEVRVHTWPEGPGSIPRDLLQALEDRADVRDAIAGAEVIGIETVPVGTGPGDLHAETCVPADPTPRDPPPRTPSRT